MYRHFLSIAASLAVWLGVVLAEAEAQTSVPYLPPPSNQADLQRRLARMQAEIDQLRTAQIRRPAAEQGAPSLSTGYYQNQAGAQAVNAPAPQAVYVPTPAPAAKPKFPTAQIGGFFQADAGWFNQDPTNIASVGNLQNGADFRRARLNAHGNAWDNVSYIIEADFGVGGRPSFADVAADFHEVPLLSNIKIGYFRQPVGLDALTSVRQLTFLERALPFTFVPFRRLGVMTYDMYGADDNGTYAFSLSRAGANAWGGDFGDEDGWAFNGRVTYVPFYNDDFTRLIHFGGSYAHAGPSSPTGLRGVRYATAPEAFIGDSPLFSGTPAFVNTGFIPAQNTNVMAAEMLVLAGPLHAQGQYTIAAVNQLGGPNVAFTGGYGQVGVFLFGQNRPYIKASGTLGRLRDDYFITRDGTHPIAVELAGRISFIDLNDKNIRGGQMRNLTAGLNLYFNPYTKFQLNYINARLNDPTFGLSDADILAARFQVGF
jgi:phosphate-selective porin OprO/OprP